MLLLISTIVEETTELQGSREVIFHANTRQDGHEPFFSLKIFPSVEAIQKVPQSKLSCKNVLNTTLQVTYCWFVEFLNTKTTIQ